MSIRLTNSLLRNANFFRKSHKVACSYFVLEPRKGKHACTRSVLKYVHGLTTKAGSGIVAYRFLQIFTNLLQNHHNWPLSSRWEGELGRSAKRYATRRCGRGGARLMAATSEGASYKPNVPVETDDGTRVAIVAGSAEAVQLLIPHRSGKEPQPDVSVWWNGSASPRVVRDWVAQTMKNLNNPALECRVEVWADEAPEEGQSYRFENVEQIVHDIQEWANDGAVGCSISDAQQKQRELVYMWAELKGQDDQRHPGEVGLKYAAKTISTDEGKLVFSRLLQDTAYYHITTDQIDQVYTILRNHILVYAR